MVGAFATWQEEENLKRTRRVEVIRYARRSTISSDGESLEHDLITEQAIDALLGVPHADDTSLAEFDFQKLEGELGPATTINSGGLQNPLLRLLKKLTRR